MKRNTFSPTITILKIRTQITRRQTIENRLRTSSTIHSNNVSQSRRGGTKESTDEILCRLNDARIQICPCHKWRAVRVKIRISGSQPIPQIKSLLIPRRTLLRNLRRRVRKNRFPALQKFQGSRRCKTRVLDLFPISTHSHNPPSQPNRSLNFPSHMTKKRN